MDSAEIINLLSNIVFELDVRDTSCNTTSSMSVYSWDTLCDMGIDLFKQLKRIDTKE